MSALPLKNFSSFDGGSFTITSTHFPLHVDIFSVRARVVVPVVLGRIDAVAHKHNRRIDVGGRLPRLILGHDLVAIRQIERRAIGRHKAELRLVLHRVHRVQRNALEVRAVVAGRLNARQRELRGDVLRRQLASARPRTAAFQQVERQKSHMRANLLAIDRRRRGARPGRQPGNFRYRYSPPVVAPGQSEQPWPERPLSKKPE